MKILLWEKKSAYLQGEEIIQKEPILLHLHGSFWVLAHSQL